jgi:hypothetical protein
MPLARVRASPRGGSSQQRHRRAARARLRIRVRLRICVRICVKVLSSGQRLQDDAAPEAGAVRIIEHSVLTRLQKSKKNR